MKVSEAMARAVHEERVPLVFNVLGDGNLALLTAMTDEFGVRLVHARHEGAAVAMADGYGRATGEIGVASVTSGPGLTHAATSIKTASNHGSPVVVLTGDVAADDLVNPQRFDQRWFAGSCGGFFCPVSTVTSATEDVQRAFLFARRDRRPVLLNMPLDVQGEEYGWTHWTYESSSAVLGRPPRPVPRDDALEEFVSLLRGSRHPVIIVGRGAADDGALSSILALAAQLGALTTTTLLMKNALARDPFHAGIAGLFTDDVAASLLAEADLVLAVGASLNYFTSEGGYLWPNATLAQIDLRPSTWSPGAMTPDAVLVGDAAATVERIVTRLRATGHHNEGFRTDDVEQRLRETRAPRAAQAGRDRDTVHPRDLVEALEPRLPDDCLAVVGSGHFWSFPICYLRRPFPFMFTVDFGAIGQALPMAIGAAFGREPRPVVVFEGDSGLMMNVQELETAVRFGQRLLVVVMNDGLLGSEFHKANAKGLNPEHARMGRTDFAAIARAMGMRAEPVRALGDLDRCVDEWLDGEGPMLLDVAVDDEVVSPLHDKLYFGAEHALG